MERKKMKKKSLTKRKKERYDSVVGEIIKICNSIYGSIHEKAASKVADQWVDSGLHNHPKTKEEGIVFLMMAYEAVIHTKKYCYMDKHKLFSVEKKIRSNNGKLAGNL
jgi:hypothetical protein